MFRDLDTDIGLALELLTVGLLAAVDLWLALPVAFALPIPHAAAAVVMTVGGSLGAYLAALLTDQIKLFIERRYSGYERMLAKTEAKLEQYGIVGIGLTAPIILGPLLTTVTAIVLGANKGTLLVWITLGNTLWCFIFYLALRMGAFL